MRRKWGHGFDVYLFDFLVEFLGDPGDAIEGLMEEIGGYG